jgi:hypothetical protein
MEIGQLYGVFLALKIISLLAKCSMNKIGSKLVSMAILKPRFIHHLPVEKDSQLRANTETPFQSAIN